MRRAVAIAFSAVFLVACGQTAQPVDKAAAPAPAPAEGPSEFVGQTLANSIVNVAGAEIGRATLTEGPHGLFVRLDFSAGALPEGWHGVHFHSVGTCGDPVAGFTASGSHVGHAEGAHGLLNATGPEPGDLPSIFAPGRGAFGAELYSTALRLGLGEGSRAPVADADGSAFIIHASHDDQTTQPIGGAGDRIACVAFTAQ